MRKLITGFMILLTASWAMALNPGDLVVNEIMQNPAAVADSDGEWFEVYNATELTVNLNGLVFTEDAFGNIFTVGSDVLIDAGGYALLARNADPLVNGGLPTVDYVYPGGYYLGNSSDEVIILEIVGIDTTVIDEVWYDNGATFPDPNGASMALLSVDLDNNVGANWYEESTFTYGDGDYGTPGAANQQEGFPLITDVSQVPGAPGSSDDVDITATVTDPATRTVANVDLIYDVDGAPAVIVDMTPAGDIYSGTIPAQIAGSVVTWRIEATDDEDNTSFFGPVVYTVVDVPLYSIYDIQYSTDPDYPSPYEGQMVQVTGIVTAIGLSGDGSFFLQDDEAPWCGIQIYGNNDGVAIDDSVTVTGIVEEYYTQTELHIYGSDVFTIHSSGHTPVEPLLVPVGTAYTEPYESVLVRVENTTCVSLPDGYGEWEISDGVDTGLVDDWFVSFTPTLGQCYDIQGLVYFYYNYKICPRDLSEITICGGGNLPPTITDVAHVPLLPTSVDIVTVSATVTDDVGVASVVLNYSVGGGGYVPVAMTPGIDDLYSGDIPAQVDGSHVDYYLVATDTPDGDTTTSDIGFYDVIDVYTCEDISNIRVVDVDGVPVMEGQAVMVCGVLTVAHEFGSSGPGYLVHETGSVAFHGGVFGDDTSLIIGDEVEVIGIVGAYNGLTQIQDPPVVNFIGHVGPPTPTVVTLATLGAGGEAWEAQLVTVEGVTLVDPENWPAEGDYATVILQQGVDTYDMYIDRDTNIDGSIAPTGTFNVTGVIGQYDTTLPWTEGYNISPRMLDDVGGGGEPPVVTIYDIQYTTDPSGDSPLAGQMVTTSGIVYAVSGAGFFIQDDDATWSGIQVFGANNQIVVGDEVTVTGQVVEYYNFTELTISDSTAYTILTSGNPLYPVALGTIPAIYVEDYEGVFVGVQNVTCSNIDLGYGEWEITDGTNLGVVNDLMYAYVPVLDECFDLVQGALTYGFGAYKIEPREAGDIVNCATLDAPVVTITYSGGSAILTWDPVDGATDYRVHVSTEPYGGWDAGTLTGGLTTYTYPSTGMYFFHVVALN